MEACIVTPDYFRDEHSAERGRSFILSDVRVLPGGKYRQSLNG